MFNFSFKTSGAVLNVKNFYFLISSFKYTYSFVCPAFLPLGILPTPIACGPIPMGCQYDAALSPNLSSDLDWVIRVLYLPRQNYNSKR